ncbi:NAD(P)/FAD-dependent oxidoreductase [Hydrogenophaga sp. R2]|uniref:NAD(P)/FAD-dependent oxidoreductase n=1 Tax=Hydrogenophaga sp. R2 TaxID=3132827 RepID=UPI003CE6D471
MASDSIVIVGGGHAAAALCASLVDAGQGHRVELVCAEDVLPYQRPPLSKAFLKEAAEPLQLHKDGSWFAAQGITVHQGDRVVEIKRDSKEVMLSSGRRVGYGHLVLATGTRARQHPELSVALDNVFKLRNAADAQLLRHHLHTAAERELVVMGGGFIGLEVAATARQLNWSVHVLESASRLLARALSPELSEFILQHHNAMGTVVDLGVSIGGFNVQGRTLTDIQVAGAPRKTSSLLLSIGAIPEVELAAQAGLQIDNGVYVDRQMRTSDQDILAIGDCTSFDYRGARIRLESVQNANDQAKVAAATLIGSATDYQPTPWFWSEQGGLRLQMVGLWRPGLAVVPRAGTTPASFSLFHYAGDELLAVESANAPVDHMWARKLIEAGRSPSFDLVADRDIPLKSLL